MIYNVANTSAIGRRCKVFVNGNAIDKVIYADTVKGIVIYYPTPLRVRKGTEEVYSRKLKGVVTVELIA